MNTPRPLPSSSHSTSPRAILARSIAALAVLTAAPFTASAADRFKADNADSLDLTTSWFNGQVPGFDDVAVWDSTVTAANSTLLGLDTSWGGLRISNPAGPVEIQAGNTLTLGRFGIDLSAATQNLTLNHNVTLLAAAQQEWKVGAGRTLTVGGTFTRAANAVINFDTTAGGAINLSAVAPSTLVGRYATINRTDFAATDALGNLVEGNTLGTYTANPNTGAANPNLTGTFAVLDFVNSNTTPGQTGVRIGSSTNITITTGLRFNTPHATGLAWTVDLAGRNLNIGNAAILVTANVGAGNVEINGTGNIRLGAGSELTLEQFNTAGDLIINGNITQPGGAGAQLTKTGAGRVIIASNGNSYTGATRIYEGTLQIGNGGATGAINAASAVTNNGTLAFNRNDTVVFPNTISGSGAVTQAGSGVLILSGGNSYTGATNFNAGTTEFTTLGNFGAGTALNFNGGALRYAAANTEDISVRTVTLNADGGAIDTNGNNVTLANSIGNAGPGGLTKSGAGILTLSGANNYSGSTTVSAGTLNLANGSGSATGAGNISVAAGATLMGTGTSGGTTSVVSGGILAPGAGLGTLTLGGLTLSAGSILDFEFDATAAPDDLIATTLTNGLTLDGGGFHLYQVGTTNAFAETGIFNLFSFAGSPQGVGTGALSVLNAVAGFSYDFGISGNFVTLTIDTSGLITAWNVTGGGTWGDDGNWTNTAPNEASATANFHGAITAPSVITLDGSKTVGFVSFNHVNAYTIAPGSGGSLILDNGGDAAAIEVIAGSHTISAPVFLSSDLSVNTLDGASVTVSGDLSGAPSLTKVGPGSLALTGTNSYAGGTFFDAGAIEFSTLGNLGSGALTFAGGALRWAAGNTEDVSSALITFDNGGGTFDTNGNDVTLFNSVGNFGPGGFTKAGAGTLTASFSNSYLGATTITGGTLSISTNDALGDTFTGAGLTLDGGTLRATNSLALDNFGTAARPITVAAGGGGLETDEFTTLTIPGVIAGSGTLTKSGLGLLALNGNNAATFSGPVTIEDGEIALGGGAGNLQQAIGTGPITFRGGTLTMNGHFGNNGLGYGGLGNALIVPAGETGTLQVTQRGALTSTLSGDGTFNLVVAFIRGDITTNWNAFNGQINVTAAGGGADFRLSGFAPLNIPNARLDLGAGVTMYQNFNPPSGGNPETVHNIGELSGAAGSFLAGNPVAGRFANWTVGALGTDSSFDGTIIDSAGAARLTKVGIGTLTLTGTNTFTGRTLVSEGTLALGNVRALQNSTLDTGNFGSTVTFTAGVDTYFLGGLQGFTDLPFGANSLDIGANGETTTFNGSLASSGNLTKAGEGALTLNGAANYTGDTTVNGGVLNLNTALSVGTTLTANAGTTNTSVSQTLSALVIGAGATVVLGASPSPSETLVFSGGGFADADAGGSAVQIAAVPEPGAATLLLAGALGLCGARRRRSQATATLRC